MSSDTLFEDTDIETIKKFIDTELTRRHAVPAPMVFDGVRSNLSKSFDKVSFTNALSSLIKGDRMPGYISCRGRSGGIRKITPTDLVKLNEKVVLPPKSETVSAPPPKAKVEPKATENSESINESKSPPVPVVLSVVKKIVAPKAIDINELSKVMIGDQYFEVPISEAKMETLLTKVCKATEDLNGRIKFNGKAYQINGDTEEFLNNIVFYFFNGSWVTKSDMRGRVISDPMNII